MVLFYIFNYNVIWAAIISAIVGAGVVTAYFLFFKKGGTENVKAEKAPSASTLIVEGIANNAEAFSEMYEPVWALANGKLNKKEEVFSRWNEIAADSDFGDAFASKFGDYASWKKGKWSKKATKLVKYIFKAGVTRSSDVIVLGDEDTAEKYVYAGSSSIETDAEYDVLAPYWEINGTVVDKGVIR